MEKARLWKRQSARSTSQTCRRPPDAQASKSGGRPAFEPDRGGHRRRGCVVRSFLPLYPRVIRVKTFQARHTIGMNTSAGRDDRHIFAEHEAIVSEPESRSVQFIAAVKIEQPTVADGMSQVSGRQSRIPEEAPNPAPLHVSAASLQIQTTFPIQRRNDVPAVARIAMGMAGFTRKFETDVVEALHDPFRSMAEEDADRRGPKQVMRDPAKRPFPHARMTVAARDDQSRAAIGGEVLNGLGDPAPCGRLGMRFRRNAMPPEPGGHICGSGPRRLGVAIVDFEDMHGRGVS